MPKCNKEVIKIDNQLVYIILLNYIKYEDTIECLQSLKNIDYPNYRIVVCDNASPNQSEKYIMEWIDSNGDKSIQFIQTGSNLGFAGGNNVGIRYALDQGAEYIWLLNNDTVVDSGALMTMVNRMNSNRKIGICGSKLMSYYNRTEVVGLAGWNRPVTAAGGHILEPKDLHRLTYIIGASMLFRREVFENVGLLQDDYFLYFEELDMAERIRNKYAMTVELNSIVYHKEGSSIGNDTPFSEFYLLKNCLKYTWRFHKLFFPIVFTRLTLRIFHPFHKRIYNRKDMFFKVTRTFLKEIFDKNFNCIPRYR